LAVEHVEQCREVCFGNSLPIQCRGS
jgi:hypothetical protein